MQRNREFSNTGKELTCAPNFSKDVTLMRSLKNDSDSRSCRWNERKRSQIFPRPLPSIAERGNDFSPTIIASFFLAGRSSSRFGLRFFPRAAFFPRCRGCSELGKSSGTDIANLISQGTLFPTFHPRPTFTGLRVPSRETTNPPRVFLRCPI